MRRPGSSWSTAGSRASIPRPDRFFHREALQTALLIGGLPALLQPISGDLLAKSVAVHQPAKLAAMEALFHTEAGAPFVLGGLPDEDRRTVRYGLFIPGGLSVLLHYDPQAVVPGLDAVPREDWPPVAVVHLAFQLMVACGLILAALAVWSGWRWIRGRSLASDRWLLRGLVAAAPLGFVAIEAGWVVTEVGRQPWIIDHVVRTADAVTPMPGLWIPMTTFTLLYVILSAVVIWAMRRHVAATDRRTLEPVHETAA
jgi:cytochrome bd ubiquinol oxidase subunit I